jgi:hypothetical protein
VEFFSDTETRTGTLTALYAGASETSQFGPELSFGRQMTDLLGCDSSTCVAIIKYANGATSLYSHWYGGGDGSPAGDGPEYIAFQQAVSDGMTALTAKHTNAVITIEGMIWMQGEYDAVEPHSTDYYANLKTFIADVRATYGARLPFVVGRLSSNQTGAAPELIQDVQDAQTAAAAESTLNGLVYTESFPLQDAWHFNPEGQLGLGKEFANQMAYILWVTRQLSAEEVDTGYGAVNADPDLDGVVNINEFISGTDVLNADSAFIVSINPAADNTVEIRHPSNKGRLYQIESCSHLAPDAWIADAPYTNGVSGTLIHTITNSLQSGFFRVRAKLP